MATNPETREKVRALVREVLKNVPAESEPPIAHEPEHVIVNSLKAKAERDFDRDESAKSLLTEDDLRGLEHGARVRVAASVKLTPLASDIVSEKGIILVRKQSRSVGLKVRTVAIGSDHGGFQLKEQLKGYLDELGLQNRDFGTNSTDAVDYPDFAHAVARAVAEGEADLGIVIDGAGVGSAMTANKVPGVRAAACYSVKVAVNSREHNGANVLTLGSGTINASEMRDIVRAWLAADLTEDRHKRRVAKIDAVERQYRS